MLSRIIGSVIIRHDGSLLGRGADHVFHDAMLQRVVLLLFLLPNRVWIVSIEGQSTRSNMAHTLSKASAHLAFKYSTVATSYSAYHVPESTGAHVVFASLRADTQSIWLYWLVSLNLKVLLTMTLLDLHLVPVVVDNLASLHSRALKTLKPTDLHTRLQHDVRIRLLRDREL